MNVYLVRIGVRESWILLEEKATNTNRSRCSLILPHVCFLLQINCYPEEMAGKCRIVKKGDFPGLSRPIWAPKSINAYSTRCILPASIRSTGIKQRGPQSLARGYFNIWRQSANLAIKVLLPPIYWKSRGFPEHFLDPQRHGF